MSRSRGSQKTGGRQRGTPNKVTAEIRSWVEAIIYDGREQFQKDMQELTPRERVKAVLSLLQYVLPKQQALSPDGATLAEVRAVREMLQGAPDEYLFLIADKLANDS